MASWRDTASQQAQADLDGLLGQVLGFAQQQLTAPGEFYPYAAVADAGAQVRMVAADTGNDRPESADLVTTLVNALSKERSRLRAAAIVADVRLAERNKDAVRVTLDHSEHVALTVLLPYRQRRSGSIDYENLEVGTAAAFIWRSN